MSDWKDATQYQICPCCGQELDGYIQHYDEKYNRPDRVMVTCKNDACCKDVRWQTKSPEEHAKLCSKSA